MQFELEKYRKEEPIIRETADQVKKDFGFYDIRIVFTGEKESPYLELAEQILPEISHLLHHEFERLMSLLYKIDVDDKAIASALEIRDQDKVAAIITDLVLRRELLKVLTRNYYRQKRLMGGEDSL